MEDPAPEFPSENLILRLKEVLSSITSNFPKLVWGKSTNLSLKEQNVGGLHPVINPVQRNSSRADSRQPTGEDIMAPNESPAPVKHRSLNRPWCSQATRFHGGKESNLFDVTPASTTVGSNDLERAKDSNMCSLNKISEFLFLEFSFLLLVLSPFQSPVNRNLSALRRRMPL